MIGIGTIVNTAAIVVGGAAGMLFKKGIPQRFQEIIFTAAGATTFLLGVTGVVQNCLVMNSNGSFSTNHMLMLMLSLIIGAVIGEALKIEDGFEKFGNMIKKKLSRGEGSVDVGTGFANLTILFCAGAMAIIGSIQDGVMGDPTMLFTKAVLDGISALIFATVYGFGAILAAISVLVYQGGLTLLSTVIEPYLSTLVVTQMSLVGSAVLMLIGFNLWGIKKFKVANLIPAAFLPLIYSLIIQIF